MFIKDQIEKYINLAKVHQSVDYADKKSVKQSNKAMDNMIELAKEINNFENGIDEFSKLLDFDEFDLKYYAAFHILEYMNAIDSIKTRCLGLIKDRAIKENNLGYKYWLSDWEKANNK